MDIKKECTGYILQIYQNGKVKTDIYGDINLNKEKMTIDSIFDVASITKLFTSIVMHQIIDEKIIDLDTKIQDIESKFCKLNNVTFRDLLGHKKEIWSDGHIKEVNTIEEFYNKIYNSIIYSDTFGYSDVNYIILSILLEEIFKKPFIEIVTERIFKPLDLKNTSFGCKGRNNVVSTGVLMGEIHDPKANIAEKHNIYLGHAGIFTTAKDLMKVLECFLKMDIIFNKRIVERMLVSDEFNKYTEGGVRHTIKNREDDLPRNANNHCVKLRGYTGPDFIIDFENKIIILLMINLSAINNNRAQKEKFKISDEFMNEIYNKLAS